MRSLVKDPDAVLDFCFDWSDWLNGEEITEFQLFTTGVDAVNNPAAYTDGSRVVVWLENGMANSNASVTCRIQTPSGRIDDRTIHIRIQER